MKKMLSLVLLLGLCATLSAQNAASPDRRELGNWTVTVNEMDPARREMITQMVENLQSRGGATRGGVLSAMALSAGKAGLTTLVDVASDEVVRLMNLEKNRKNEWRKMISKECSYVDSLSSIRGLNDFYARESRLGALDPSDINFDGISVRGMRDGHEVLYLSCHIDDSRLDHLFLHGKFYLVVDTIAFHPYECHLPNLGANGISLQPGQTTERDNRFSYDERDQLTIGMELSLSSSWINEAITIQKDVELGRFNMSVKIPSGTEVYTYSRAAIDRNRKRMAEEPEGAKLDTTYVTLSGDSFVVPRSFMPINGNECMWGTGEYKLKVKFRESCRFSQDATHNGKLKHWKQDYQQLRKMQKESRKDGADKGYFATLWEQKGNTLVKTMVKSGLSTGAAQAGLTK